MGSQNTERAGTEETLSAKPATKITRNQIVPASVDPFYDFYMKYGSMKNALELHKRLNQTHHESNQILSPRK
jgi:hypothetical protein